MPFKINNFQVGLVRPEVLKKIQFHHDIFYVVRELITNKVQYVTMAPNDCKARSEQFACVMRYWKDRDLFPTLRGWRNEVTTHHSKFVFTCMKIPKIYHLFQNFFMFFNLKHFYALT